MYWKMAAAFREWVQETQPDADYVMFTDCAYTPGRWEQGFVHLVVCDRRGQWVITQIQNSDHEEYQAVKPTSPQACDRLAVMVLESQLR